MSHRRLAGCAAAGSILLLGALALPAGAHVTVSADDTAKGADDSILTFRVPNEMDNATVTKLDIKFPTNDPLASVEAEPKPGWTIQSKTVTFAKPIVTDDGTIKQGTGEIVWTADSSGAIPVGEFGSFRVLVGPLPDDESSVSFPALQTYSNGQTVSWVDPTLDPKNPPEHPAATLDLTAPEDDDSGATPAASASTAPVVTVSSVDYATKSQADNGRTLGIIGIIVGAVGLLVGAAGLARSRRA